MVVAATGADVGCGVEVVVEVEGGGGGVEGVVVVVVAEGEDFRSLLPRYLCKERQSRRVALTIIDC